MHIAPLSTVKHIQNGTLFLKISLVGLEGPLAHNIAQVAPNRALVAHDIAPVAHNIAPAAYNPGGIIFSHIHLPFITLTISPSLLLLLSLLFTASQFYFGK